MNTSIVVIVSIVLRVAFAADDAYDSKYDNFDVDSLLNNERLMQSFTKCILDKGPCSPEGKDFKQLIPEALEQSCAKCSPRQKEIVRRLVKDVIAKTPETWEELKNKYDKDSNYKESFERFLNA